MQILMKGIGPVPAVLVMSGLFGLLHHLNPNATWLGTLNVFLAGVLLSAAYLRTRSLWFPFGIHIGWNLGLGPDLRISGLRPDHQLDMGQPGTGSRLGHRWRIRAEGGVLGTLAIIVAVVAVRWTRSVGVSPTLRTLLLRYPNKVYTGPGIHLDKPAGNDPRTSS